MRPTLDNTVLRMLLPMQDLVHVIDPTGVLWHFIQNRARA